MPWELEINIIDVGQGESSLIIARNPATGAVRSLLIDGGLATYAQTVHNYVVARGLLNGPDQILVTHYDVDHTGGIQALLIADNLYRVSDMIATVAANRALGLGAPNARPDQAVAAAAAAYAVALGGYNDPNGVDCSAQVALAVTATHLNYGIWTDANAVKDALKLVVRSLSGPFNPMLIPGPMKIGEVAAAAGIAAAAAIAAGGNVVASTRTAIFDSLRSTVQEGSRFSTGGIYRNAHIIDIGNTNHIGVRYTDAVAGRYLSSGNQPVQAVGTNRVRRGPIALGTEILWNRGPNAAPAPVNSPAVFIVARLKRAWNGPNASTPFVGPQPDNADSIGLIVRFNRFFYYTGADLPYQGDEPIATAVTAYGLPDPQGAVGATFAPAVRIACFKCGHHGANSSTSQNFLNTADPAGAVISCGRNQFGRGDNHPMQPLIDRLVGYAPLGYFYLTNCKYATNHIPASQGLVNQLGVVGNKSRVAGVNDDNVVSAETDIISPRQRGNIRVSLNQDESDSPYNMGPLPFGAVLRQFHVRYFEEDGNVNNFRIENVTF
ncbi:MAG TPA: MBL fold metallo-hydrolase [Pyrinomonadaceae bacterium]|jgi:hypothetical protein